jgi:chorismate mutase / prephenate dehydratase
MSAPCSQPLTPTKTEYAVLPVYNTREGEKKQYFRFFDQIKTGFWVDNVILRSNLSLGVFEEEDTIDTLRLLMGRREVFHQSEEFIEDHLAGITEMSVRDIGPAIAEIRAFGPGRGELR